MKKIDSDVNSSDVFNEAALTFLKEHMNEEQFNSVMRSDYGKSLPYVAARVFLSNREWKEFVWISQHGSLEGFKE